MIEFDRILDRIGHLGRYQILLCFLVYWQGIPAGLHSIASVIYAAEVPFRCSVPPLDNSTLYLNLTEVDIRNYTTPGDGCQRYGYNLSLCVPPDTSCVNMSAPSIDCDQGYHFDTSQFESTIVSEVSRYLAAHTVRMASTHQIVLDDLQKRLFVESKLALNSFIGQWDLVCDRKILNSVQSSLFFAGMWFGAIFFGFLSDWIGRRYTIFIASIGTLISGVATAFAPWFELFVVLRFFSAVFSHAGFLIMFVYVVEITGKKRTLTGVHTHTAFAVGYTLNSLFGYFFRDWRRFYFYISLTPIPYFIIHFFIPESPRWHFSNGRNEEGKRLANIFAKYNKKQLTEEDWKAAEVSETDTEVLNKKYSSLDLFRSKYIRLITLNCVYSWLVTAMVYYGLSLNAGSLAGDIYLNNALNGLVEVGAYVFTGLTMDRLGRKTLLAMAMILQGSSCIISTVLNELANGNEAMITAGVVFAFLGKVGVAGSFAIIYNFTAELYPTVLRGNALGFGSMAARIGSISSPYIILLQDYVSWLPFTIFGVMSLLAGFLSFAFPETSKITMPQTIPEAEQFYSDYYNKKTSKHELQESINSSYSDGDDDEHFSKL